MSTWSGNHIPWLPITPKADVKLFAFTIYRYLLTTACILAGFSLTLTYGFVFPKNITDWLVWLNFSTVCLFFALAVMRIIHSYKMKAPILYAILETLLIAALIVEFIILRIFYPIESHYTLHLIHIYIIVLQAYFLFELGRRMFKAGRRLFLLSFSPALTVSLSFLALILMGAFGLLLPRATHGTISPNISFIDALFTSTSAVCVTGLIVVDTATAFSRMGQAILLILIQLGAFGIMIFVGLFAFTFGSSSSLRGRTVLQDMVTKEGGHRVTTLLRTMLLTTFILESIGAVLLYPGLYTISGTPSAASFDAVFHSISAFCNAGFSTFSNSLESFSASPLVILTVCLLIFFGGIGFSAVYEIVRWFRRRVLQKKMTARLSLHTATVVQVSLTLIGFGFLAILAGTDWSGRSWNDIFLSSLFQSVTPRTAGFNSIPLTSIAPWCLIVVMIFMFIGGAPGGTAGGIKVSTVALLFHTSRSLLKGRRHVEIRHRTIAQQAIMSAFVISGLAVAYVAIAVIALVWAEPNLPFFDLLFEVISAFGTVGLSLGTTAKLGTMGKIIIIITMYLGRVGPLTVFLALMHRRDEALYEYPAGSIVVS